MNFRWTFVPLQAHTGRFLLLETAVVSGLLAIPAPKAEAQCNGGYCPYINVVSSSQSKTSVRVGEPITFTIEAYDQDGSEPAPHNPVKYTWKWFPYCPPILANEPPPPQVTQGPANSTLITLAPSTPGCFGVMCQVNDTQEDDDPAKDPTETVWFEVEVRAPSDCCPPWSCQRPADSGGPGCGANYGPSRGDPVLLDTGVESYSTGPDIVAFNAQGPPAFYQRTFLSNLALEGYHSTQPWLPAGWVDNFDIVIAGAASGADRGGSHSPIRIVYPTGASDLLAQGTLGEFVHTDGVPYIVSGERAPLAPGTWKTITLRWTDGNTWFFKRRGAINLLYLTWMGNSLGQGVYLDRMATGQVTKAWAGDESVLTYDEVPENVKGPTLLSFDDISITDAPGARKVELHGATVSQVGPAGGGRPPDRWTYSYDIQGRLTGVTVPDPNGGTTPTASSIAYDPASGRVSSVTDANGNVHSYNYGVPEGNSVATEVTISDGSITFYHYRVWEDAPNGYPIRYLRDARGAVTALHYAYTGGNATRPSRTADEKARERLFSYDEFGNPTGMTSLRSVLTTLTYDYGSWPTGKVTAVQEGSKPGHAFTFYYPSGLVKTVTSPSPTGSGTVTATYLYDGAQDTSTPPSMGFLTEVRSPDSTGVDRSTRFSYGASPKLGCPIAVTDRAGKAWSFSYDNRGNILSSTDPLQNRTDYTYTIEDKVLTVTYPSTGGVRCRTVYVYASGDYGPLKAVREYDGSDTLLRETSWTYGPEGELLSETSGATIFSVEYDALYRVTHSRDGLGNATVYVYDANGDMVEVKYPNIAQKPCDHVLFSDFDASGIPGTRTTFAANCSPASTTFTYEPTDDQISSVTAPDGSVSVLYDTYGRPSQVTDRAGQTVYTFNALDDMTRVQWQPAGQSWSTDVTYGYNPDGSRSTMGAFGSSFSYLYDPLGRLTQLTSPNNEVSSWEYLDNGSLSAQTLGPAVKSRYSYDPSGRLTSLSNRNLYESYAYSQFTNLTYDGIDDLLTLTASFGTQLSLRGPVPMAPGLSFFNGTTTYGYAKTAPLDTSTYGLLRSEQTSRFTTGYTKTFTYDGAGNLLTLRSSNTIPYNADNQRTGAPQGQPAETYVYDGSGNPTVYRNVNLTYDSGNHLTSYGTTTPILSLYGAEGLRRKKTVGSTSTWYVYDGADPVFELNANGTVKATNVFGANGLVSRRVNGSTSFYAVDPLGHAANLVNSAGSVLYNCGYDAYGQPYGNATMLTYGYGAQHGYYRDSEAAYADNLLLCTNRWYDPSTARWLTRDPIGSAGGPNLYGYVGGDPMGGADPSGLRPLTSQDGIRFGILRSMPSKDTKERPIPGLVEGAIAALKAEIDAVPAGCDDPARLRALWYAIDNSASNTWDAWGSPFGYANATTGQRIPYTRNKCNVFIADCYGYGAGVGFGGSGVPTLPYRGAHRVYSANEWASTRNPIPHFAASRCPRAGDIVAFSGDSHGHMTIKVGPGVLIYTDGKQIMLGSFDRVLADNSGWMGRRYYR